MTVEVKTKKHLRE